MKNKVIICDDDEMMQMLLGVFLKKENVEVVPVLTGGGLLAAAKEHLPVLIFLDMMMPDKDGLTALEELHADPVTAQIPVIMMSATITPETMSRAKEAGAREFIDKPFKPARIQKAVREFLA
jgi:CheY-like chemotaxis protein